MTVRISYIHHRIFASDLYTLVIICAHQLHIINHQQVLSISGKKTNKKLHLCINRKKARNICLLTSSHDTR